MGIPFSVTSAAPAGRIIAVTPSDTTDLPDGPCRGLLIGTGGVVTIHDGGGVKATLVPMQTGYNWVQCTRVWAAGLTAVSVWALY